MLIAIPCVLMTCRVLLFGFHREINIFRVKILVNKNCNWKGTPDKITRRGIRLLCTKVENKNRSGFFNRFTEKWNNCTN